jgi:feruloyl esterase
MAAIAAPYGAAVAATCEGIGSLKWHQVTITSAEPVVAPSTIGNPASDLPANMAVPFCRVAATMTPTADSDIKMEVWLPAPERWNGKFEGIGNGGLAGALPLDAMTAGLERGYATAATDTGHDN